MADNRRGVALPAAIVRLPFAIIKLYPIGELYAVKSRFLLLAIMSSALMLGPALAATTEADLMKACKSDVQKLCPHVPMGGGKILECLKKHENQMTVGCAKELKKLKS